MEARKMTDIYLNYCALSKSETEGRDYQICVREAKSAVTIIAPHGGKIEPGTSEITETLASCEFKYYKFEGKKPKCNRNLHITSINFDEPKCLELVNRSQVVIAIHGKADEGYGIFVGGKDKNLKECICEELKNVEFAAQIETNTNLAGMSQYNICNRGNTKEGVQLEIERGLRNELRRVPDRMNKFCDAIRSAINNAKII